MSFWRTFGFQSVSPIDTLLDSENFTLENLLDEDDMLTECKGQNKKLLDFLINPTQLMKLINFILTSHEEEEEKLRYKYPYLACEILCLDIWDISEAIFAHEELLAALWGFLSKPAPLDSLECSYLTRICGVLLQRQVRDTFAFLQRQTDIIPGFITHISNPTVAELLLKLVACEETNDGAGILSWLINSSLVILMLQQLSNHPCALVHENVTQTFESIIEQTPINRPSPFIDALLADESLTILVNALQSPSKSCFLAAIAILAKLLERFTRDETTLDSEPIDALPLIIQKSIVSLDHLTERLKIPAPPSSQEDITILSETRVVALPSSYNKVISPVGQERLKILDFLSTLIRLRYISVDALIVEKGLLQLSFDLFVAYPWNNFLHTGVRNLVSDVFSGINLTTKLAILEQVHLLDILMDLAIQNQTEVQDVGISSGKGYMGFVTQISNGIQHACSADPSLAKILAEHPTWKSYAEGLLESTNAIEKTDFGEPRGDMQLRSDSSSEDTPDYGGSNQELVSVFKQYLSTHQFNGSYPSSFPDHDEDDDDYDDDDSPAPADSTEQLVLDRTFEQAAVPYATNISGYYDAQGDTSSEDDEQDSAEFDPHEDSDEDVELSASS